MLKFSAANYFNIAKHLEMWAIHNESGLHSVEARDREVLFAIKESCQQLGLRLSAKYISEQMLPMFSDDKVPASQRFTDMVDVLSERIRDELDMQLFFHVPFQMEQLYEQKTPLFGASVIDRFPRAIVDIQEAGKCLALGRGTASVFHLMRVMEFGLRALAKGLDIPYAPSWESYLRQIETKIAEKHNRKSRNWKRDEAFYRDASGDLQAVKIAWRNPTMHIVRSYTPEEADDVLRAVRTFMQRLAGKFDEKGQLKNNKRMSLEKP